MRLTIKDPCCITARLLPGVQINDGYVAIEYARRPGADGRTRFRYYIDLPAGLRTRSHSRDDLQSGAGGANLQTGLADLLGFLSACAQSRQYAQRTGSPGENADLFPDCVGQWAERNSDELATLAMELEEAPDLIVESAA